VQFTNVVNEVSDSLMAEVLCIVNLMIYVLNCGREKLYTLLVRLLGRCHSRYL